MINEQQKFYVEELEIIKDRVETLGDFVDDNDLIKFNNKVDEIQKNIDSDTMYIDVAFSKDLLDLFEIAECIECASKYNMIVYSDFMRGYGYK